MTDQPVQRDVSRGPGAVSTDVSAAVLACYREGLLIEDICWVFELSRTQVAQIIESGTPPADDTPWSRLARLASTRLPRRG